MKKSNVMGLLFASAFLLAGTQLGAIQAEARPHDKNEKWEEKDPQRNPNEHETMGCLTREFEKVAGEK